MILNIDEWIWDTILIHSESSNSIQLIVYPSHSHILIVKRI